MSCPGPLVWFDAPDGGVILECAACDYVHVQHQATPLDAEHADTPLMGEGAA